MYDRPETAAANDRLWSLTRTGLADRGIDAPQELSRGMDIWEMWQSPELVLSQTCGLPYRTRLHGQVGLVATPVHDLPCEPGHYFSVIVARRDDARIVPADFNGARLAVNGGDSQSGWAAAVDWMEEHNIRYGSFTLSGGHAASARSVVDGDADFAAIDALTWAMIKRWDALAVDLMELGTTRASPALPFISAAGIDTNAVAGALGDAIAALRPDERNNLGLRGIKRIRAEKYLAVATPPPPED